MKNVPTNKAPSTTADLLSLSEPAAPASQPPQVAAQQNSTLLSMSATTAQQGNTADVSLRNGKLLLGFVEVR